MYGANVDMAQVQVSAAYQEDINAFNIHFYEEQLCSLEEAQSYNAYYIMMEIMLGEGLSYQYIASVERADAPLENMIKLPELRAYITDTLKAHGKEIFDNPQQVYTSYRLSLRRTRNYVLTSWQAAPASSLWWPIIIMVPQNCSTV